METKDEKVGARVQPGRAATLAARARPRAERNEPRARLGREPLPAASLLGDVQRRASSSSLAGARRPHMCARHALAPQPAAGTQPALPAAQALGAVPRSRQVGCVQTAVQQPGSAPAASAPVGAPACAATAWPAATAAAASASSEVVEGRAIPPASLHCSSSCLDNDCHSAALSSLWLGGARERVPRSCSRGLRFDSAWG